jgi:hypothetical protein
LFLGYCLLKAYKPQRRIRASRATTCSRSTQKQGRTCRIQVKSRWATDYNKAFPIRKFECDFVVHVALNRGYRHRRKIQLDGRQPPKIYVLPIEVVRKTQDPNSSWGMVHLKNVPNVEQYVDRWSLIRNFLRLPES